MAAASPDDDIAVPHAEATGLVEPKLSFLETIKTFPRLFYMCCTIEMFERFAYYGTRQVVGLYIAQADDPGGLHFTQDQKGTIFAWWAVVQSLIPMLSGGFSDRYGYKKTIAISTVTTMTGYALMGTQRSFSGFMAGCLVLAFGTAIFKPGIQGTLAQTMSKRNSSVGWGLFYWLVNVGSFLGPMYAAFMRARGWNWVFFGSVTVISFNLPMLLTYKEVDSGADKSKKLGRVVIDTLANFFLNPRLMTVVVLFSGFWMLLYQLWDLMPNFYTDWVDSLSFVKSNEGWLPKAWVFVKDPRGPQLKQEIALGLNAFLVVCFVIPMSYAVARLRVMTSITIGVLIATTGTVVYGTSPSLYVVALGILCFSLGEMLTGPKKTEFFSLIAPPGKKALYLGYVNIPIAIGQTAGAKIAAWQYGTHGEKATLALRYMVEQKLVPFGSWDGDPTHLPDVTGIERKVAFTKLVEMLGKDANEVNQILWTTYRPYQVWYPFVVIGFCSLAGIIVFSQVSKRWKDMNV